jgi:uncharacterized protein YmfQ (DUF2313 family)
MSTAFQESAFQDNAFQVDEVVEPAIPPFQSGTFADNVFYTGKTPKPPLPPRQMVYTGDRHVRRTGGDYAVSFLSLLPSGPAWPRGIDCASHDSVLFKVSRGLADYWGFVDGRAADLLEQESDPRATVELITDWERAWGLPDPCLKGYPTALFERRALLVAKMTLLGAQSRAFFYWLAHSLGVDVTIFERAPYMCGISRCGDYSGVYNPGDPTHYRWYLGPREIRFYWTIHLNARSFRYFHCNSSQTGIDRLLAIGIASDIECVFDKWKPAHTKIIYDYSPWWALDYSQMFNTQYLGLGIM